MISDELHLNRTVPRREKNSYCNWAFRRAGSTVKNNSTQLLLKIAGKSGNLPPVFAYSCLCCLQLLNLQTGKSISECYHRSCVFDSAQFPDGELPVSFLEEDERGIEDHITM